MSVSIAEFNLDHLYHMTDATGIFQHASFTTPNLAEGYCTDDNARALILAVLLDSERNAAACAGWPNLRRRSWTGIRSSKRRFPQFLSSDRSAGRTGVGDAMAGRLGVGTQ